jgi:hypothetical protein
MPDAHTLLIVVQIVDCGKLAPSTACRQGACPIPADTTFPKMASAIGGFVTSFDKAPRIAMLPSSDPLRLAKEPENLAIGVRAMLQITAQLPEALDMILLSLYGE